MATFASEGPAMGYAPLPQSRARRSTSARRDGRVFRLLVVVISGLTLNACQSAGPFYHGWIHEPAKSTAFYAGSHRSKFASETLPKRREEVVGAPDGPSHARSESSSRFSTEDRPLAEGATGSIAGFSSPIVGSAQWLREQAEQEARE